jgi:uncharacterized repeat protein (TIGR01451 family)
MSRRSLFLRILLSALMLSPIIPIAALVGQVRVAKAAVADVCGTNNTPNVIALADPTFYIDSGITPKLNATYSGYTVRAGTSSETALSIALSGFTGSVVNVASNQALSTTLPTLAPGEVTTSYFLFSASGPTETPQGHTISLLRAGVEICSRTFTYTRVAETIKALANKVDSVTQTKPSSNAQVGDQVVVTVEGHTGTLGAGPTYDPGVLSYAPTAIDTFPANAWRLETTEMTISPNGVLPTNKYVNRLFLSGASGPNRPYVAKYYFRAVDSTAVKAAVRPVQYIASGTQVKHTDVGSSVAGDLPIVDPDANITISKSVTPSLFSPVSSVVTGGTATYTLAVTNVGSTTGYLDKIVDTLPSGVTFTTGTATIGGRSATPTYDNASRKLTFYGPIAIGAGATLSVRYQNTIPNTAGVYTNSVVGYYGNALIDNSASTTTSTPATATVTVRPAFGVVDAIDDSISTSANTPITISVLTNDTPSTGVTVTVVRQPSGGAVVVNAGGTITYTPTTGFGGTDTFEYQISNGDTSDTAVVTVTVPQARFDNYGIDIATGNGTITKTWTDALGLKANDLCSTDPCTVTAASVNIGTLSVALFSGHVAGGGGFSYTTPAANTVPTSPNNYATITYTLTDANGKTSPGSGRIYISDLAPDSAATTYKTLVNINVSANDTCSSACSSTYNSAIGDALDGTVAAAGSPTTFNYTPFDHFMGIDQFDYRKGSKYGLVTVLVGAPDASIDTTYGQSVSKTVGSTTYLTAYGGAGATTPKVSCTGCIYSISTAPTKGSVSIVSSTGAFTYTPNATASGQDTFNVRLSDPTSGLQVSSLVNIFIGPRAQNDPSATDSTAYQFLMKSGTPLSFNVLSNDACPTTCTVTKLTDPTAGTVTQSVAGGGAFTYSNSTALGNYSFTYRVESSVSPGLTSTATVRIYVSGGVDDAGTTSPGLPLTLNVRANDPCTECSLSAVSKPNIGSASINVNGTITYNPPATFAGVARFTYTLTLNAQSTIVNVVATVKPDAINDQLSSLASATNVIDVLANDVCSSCLITSRSNVTGGSATISADGYSVSYAAPSSGGPYYFDYIVTDAATNQTDSATVKITLATFPSAVNDTSTTTALRAVGINVRSNDTCSSDPCSYDVASDASHGSVSLSVDPAFEFQYIPAAGFTGTDSFTYSITTALGMSRTATVTIYVTPTAAADYASAGKNQTKVITVTSNDVCFTCTVSIVTQPSSGSIGTISGGDITYIASSTPGTYTLTYRLTESDTSPTSTTDAVVTVVVGDATPDVVATNYQTPVTLDVTANDTCKTSTPNCSVTSVDYSGGPSGDSAIVVDAGAIDTSIRYTPATGFIGLVTITYTAAWSTSTATATVTILVGPSALARTTDRNTQISGNVLTGATCVGCSVSLVSAPGLGEISFGSDGSYTYTPFSDWLGTDSAITYLITDPVSGLTRDGTLTITVAALTPSIQIVKVGVVDPSWHGNPSRIGPGDRVNYTFTVTNSGLINLTNVIVVDDKIINDAADIRCPANGSSNVISSLAAGATVVCTGFDTLKLVDVNLGYIDNTATATGTATSGSASSVSAMSVENKVYVSPAVVTETPVTDSASTRVTLDRIASMTMVKAATGVTDTDNNGTDAGDIIGYSYTVTNTGNVTLYNVTVIDDKITNDATDIDCPSGGASNVYATLDPGNTVTCVGTYTATQADIDAGSVTNTGTAIATAPTGVTDPDPANSGITVTLTGGTRISITKSAGTVLNSNVSNPLGGVGDQVPYTYTITNTGLVGLVNVAVTDNKIASAAINCASSGTNTKTPLAVNASFSCVATYTITQADFDLGGVTNIATVTGDPSSGGVGPTATATVTVTTGTQSPSLTIVKSGVLNQGGNSRADAGDTIAYSYLVTNTGNVTLSNVTVTDDKIASAGISCPAPSASNVVASLAPGATATCTASYSVLQADMNVGSVTNRGTATSGSTTSFDDETVALTRVSTMTIVKSGVVALGSNARADTGDTISYSYVITNTGNVTLSNVTVTDNKIADASISCPAPSASNVVASLAPGATATCTASYSVLLADMNVGSVTNRGTATSGATTVYDDETVALTAAPALSIAKSGVLNAGGNSRADANDTIAYSYVVTNTGNVTLSNVTVTDNKIDNDSVNIDCPSGGTTNVVTTLAPGASQTCVATYTVTQGDVDAGSVSNTATATSGSTTTNGSATVTLTAAPALSIAKSGVLNAGGNSRADANDTIAYSYVVTNTGNVTLSNVTVTDNKIDNDSVNIDCPSGGTTNVVTTLAPGASQTCVATYTVTQGDVDAGSVSNTATATSGSTTTNGSATVTLLRAASMTLSKSSGGIRDLDSNGTDAGDAIDYNYVVTNTGNVTLSSLTVTDNKIDNDSVDIDCPSGGTTNVISSLAPSGTVTCVGVYTITDADVTAASVTNIGTVSASVPSGVSSLAAVTSTATVTLAIGAGVDIVMTHGAISNTNSSNPLGGVGDQVTYTYSVTNSGTATLSNVTVTDNKISSSAINCASGNSNVVSTLAGAGTFTCVATYTFTQADIDAGGVTNIGAVSGTPPGGTAVTDTDTNTVSTVLRAGSMTVTKSGVLNQGGNGRADAGDSISYSYAVTNTGNITLSNVTVTDDKIASAGISCPSPSTSNVVASLAPGATATCTASYSVLQADMNAGSITNRGTATSGSTTTYDDETVALTRVSTLTLAKSGVLALGSNSRADAGDTISYSYVVTNTGNVTLSSVEVIDDKISNDAMNIDCPSGGPTNVITTLQPAGSVTCVASYTVLQADVNAGSVQNTGTATSGSTTATGSRTVALTAAPALTITKSGTLNAGSNNVADLGETISYSYDIANTGNVTLSNVTLTDDKVAASVIRCPSGGTSNIVASMAPGATLTCVATYSVTQANIDSGLITNIGTVTSGATSATSSKTVALAGNPSLEVTKTGVLSMGSNGRADAGDLIVYSYAVKNTGNVTLRSVTVTDDRIVNDAVNIDCPASGASNAIATLEPDQTVTCVASYSVTQSNLDMGSITNTATATDGTNVATGSATVNFVDDPRVSISKSGVLDVGSNKRVDAGDTITYSFLVRNTGNLTLSNVTVTDDKIADDAVNIQCPSGATTNIKLSLPPGETVTCVGIYVVTQSDINSGSVTNVGSVTATPARGGNTTADNTVAVAMSSPTTTTTVAPTTTTTTVAPSTTTTTTSSLVTATTSASITPLKNLAAAARMVTAVDDSVTAPMGAIIEIDVLDNDIGSKLAVRSVSSPTSGTATTDGTSIIVTPDLMFKGTIDFTYVATDGTSNSTGKVSVKIVGNTLLVLPQIFLDINGNGKQDKFEPGMKGISFGVSLVGRKTLSMKNGQTTKGASTVSSSGLDNVNSTDVGAQSVLAQFSCASNIRGECISHDLPLGRYSIQAKVNLKKLGLTVTADSDGIKDLKATVDPRGDGKPDAVFGLNGTGSVFGFSYVERGDVFSYNPPMDVPLRNVTVIVTWVGLDSKIATADDLSVVTTTNSKGRYSVEGLPIGAYRVEPSASSFVTGVPLPKSGEVTVKTRSIEQFDLPIRIVGPIPDVLVRTGINTWQLVVMALLATLCGILLIAIKPKRRQTD